MIGQRLRQLRLARGFSLEALAAAIGGMISKQALSKYEIGTTRPSPEVLAKLAAALQVRAEYLVGQPVVSVKILAYRRGSRLTQREQARIESLTRHRLEQRMRLQSLLAPWEVSALPISGKSIGTPEEAEQAAEEIRRSWNLGVSPIPSVTGLLEDHCIHVLEIDAAEKFDGISALVHDQDRRALAAAVVTRKGLSGDRQRLSLTHELAHIVGCDSELTAFRAGAALLVPAYTILRDVGANRASIGPEELLLLKRRWGMSAQAILRRLRDLGIIGETHYKWWCKQINLLGWRKQEPSPIPAEQATWLHRSVQRALSENLITKEEADEMVGEEMEVDQRLSLFQL